MYIIKSRAGSGIEYYDDLSLNATETITAILTYRKTKFMLTMVDTLRLSA